MTRFHEQIHGVYFDDLDSYGVLHNARYLLLFERTLGSFWQHMDMGELQDEDHPDRWHLVRANEVSYDVAVRGTGKVRVRVWVERLGRTSLTFGFRMMPLDADTALATGRRTVVRVDPETFWPAPWTDDFRQRLAEWLPEEAA